MIRQAGEHVGKPGLRIDVVELGGGNQRVDRGGAPAAFVGAGEGPVLLPEGNGPQLAFGRVVRHAKAPIIEEAGEGVPAVEAVVDRFGRVAVFGEPGTLFAQPSLQFDDQWPATLLAQALRSCGMRPLISRSMANRTSMRLTASAAIGALLSRARSKNLRRA